MPHKKSEVKSEIAQDRPRDEEGHFVHAEKKSKDKTGKKNGWKETILEHVHYSKSHDDLIDLRVGNPLERITKLLEDIKKQKAFSFTLKGSLGVMGVFLTLSVFGIFGGGQILCDKGTQTHLGNIKILNTFDAESREIPFLSWVLDKVSPKAIHNRVILIKNNGETLRIPYTKQVEFDNFRDRNVLATGVYDACAGTLKVADKTAVEVY